MMSRGDLTLEERLDRIEAKQDAEMELLVQVRLEIAELKAKASVWGAVAGLVAGGLVAQFLG